MVVAEPWQIGKLNWADGAKACARGGVRPASPSGSAMRAAAKLKRPAPPTMAAQPDRSDNRTTLYRAMAFSSHDLVGGENETWGAENRKSQLRQDLRLAGT